MPPPDNACNRYWDDADWLPPWYIFDHWCQQDTQCRQAKQQALFSACERGEVNYRRSDGKTFDDPVHELSARRLLLIERESFETWVSGLEGKIPWQPPCNQSSSRHALLGLAILGRRPNSHDLTQPQPEPAPQRMEVRSLTM